MPVLWRGIIRSTTARAEKLGHKLGYFYRRAWAQGFGCVLKRAECERCGLACHIHFKVGDGFLVEGSALEKVCGDKSYPLPRADPGQ
jgi:hypothetical protein